MNLEWRWAALKNGFQDATAYRVEFLLEVLGYAVVPAAIQMMFWYALFKLGGAQDIRGMGYEDLVRYTWMSVLFSQVRGGNHDFELQEMIQSGSLSNYLLRPVGVVEFVYIRGIAARLLIAGFCLGVGCVVTLLSSDLSPARLVGAMVMALIGNIIHYQIGAILATVAFAWEEAYSLLMVKNLFVSLLSGELLPLNLFPNSWEWIWKSTPFYLYVFGPTQFALGKWSMEEYWQHLGISLIWVFVLWGGIAWSWRTGIRKYQSLGG